MVGHLDMYTRSRGGVANDGSWCQTEQTEQHVNMSVDWMKTKNKQQ